MPVIELSVRLTSRNNNSRNNLLSRRNSNLNSLPNSLINNRSHLNNDNNPNNNPLLLNKDNNNNRSLTNSGNNLSNNLSLHNNGNNNLLLPNNGNSRNNNLLLLGNGSRNNSNKPLSFLSRLCNSRVLPDELSSNSRSRNNPLFSRPKNVNLNNNSPDRFSTLTKPLLTRTLHPNKQAGDNSNSDRARGGANLRSPCPRSPSETLSTPIKPVVISSRNLKLGPPLILNNKELPPRGETQNPPLGENPSRRLRILT